MTNLTRKQYYERLLEHMIQVNEFAPFPFYDTEDVERLRTMIEDNKIDYDALPVECCSNCKHLSIVTEDDGSVYCIKCGSINMEIETFDNIHSYNAEYGTIWNLNEDGTEQEASNSEV